MEYNDTNLLDLFNQGLTYSQIGKQLGATRAQVSGRLRRIRKINPALVPSRKKEPKPKVKRVQVRKKVTPLPPTPKPIQFKPNRYSIGIKPRNYLQPSKADMRAMLKQAVENTK